MKTFAYWTSSRGSELESDGAVTLNSDGGTVDWPGGNLLERKGRGKRSKKRV